MNFCSRCGIEFNDANIGSNKYVCKPCVNQYAKNRGRSKTGLISRIYNNQRKRSIAKKMELPSYSKYELEAWMFGQEKFHSLFNKWVESDYDYMLVPSVDRIDDYKPYTFSNIQLMTWEENKEKGHEDIRNNKNKKKNKPIIQFSIYGERLNDYDSAMIAEHSTGIAHENIAKVLKGKRKTAGGFIWEYKEKK